MRPLSYRLLLAVLAVVALAVAQGCGSSYSAPTAPPPGGQADVTITILGMNGGASFSPDPGLVPVGKTVAWRNADTGAYGGVGGTAHHIVADGGAFDTGVLAPGAVSAPTMMSTAGAYAYHCAIHPTMTGSVTVQ
jgi:plastocyanin